ncbi:hypothetical protein OLK17_004338 [Salmonella enterica]|nr:hypothetical protein [Salmonella enterica]
MTKLIQYFKSLAHPGWRIEAFGMAAIVVYFIVVFYTEGGILDAPLFVQLNLLLIMGLASLLTALMLRFYRKGKVSQNRDNFMMSALLAALQAAYFAVNGAAIKHTQVSIHNEPVFLLGEIYQYAYWAFALYALYHMGRR